MRQSEDAFKKNVKKKPQTNNGNITGSGERELVPKAGSYQRGLLKSLMAWAIPSPTMKLTLKQLAALCFTYSDSAVICWSGGEHLFNT